MFLISLVYFTSTLIVSRIFFAKGFQELNETTLMGENPEEFLFFTGTIRIHNISIRTREAGVFFVSGPSEEAPGDGNNFAIFEILSDVSFMLSADSSIRFSRIKFYSKSEAAASNKEAPTLFQLNAVSELIFENCLFSGAFDGYQFIRGEVFTLEFQSCVFENVSYLNPFFIFLEKQVFFFTMSNVTIENARFQLGTFFKGVVTNKLELNDLRLANVAMETIFTAKINYLIANSASLQNCIFEAFMETQRFSIFYESQTFVQNVSVVDNLIKGEKAFFQTYLISQVVLTHFYFAKNLGRPNFIYLFKPQFFRLEESFSQSNYFQKSFIEIFRGGQAVMNKVLFARNCNPDSKAHLFELPMLRTFAATSIHVFKNCLLAGAIFNSVDVSENSIRNPFEDIYKDERDYKFLNVVLEENVSFQWVEGFIYNFFQTSLADFYFRDNVFISNQIYRTSCVIGMKGLFSQGTLKFEQGKIIGNFGTFKANFFQIDNFTSLLISESHFAHNVNLKGRPKGGMLFIRGGDFSLLNSFFYNNSSPQTSVLLFQRNDEFELTNIKIAYSKFYFNNGETSALSFYQQSGLQLFIGYCSFISNYFDDHGVIKFSFQGAPENYSSILTECIFDNNTADKAAVLYVGSTYINITISMCVFVRNIGYKFGGLFYSWADSGMKIHFTNCFFKGNLGQNSALMYLILGNFAYEKCVFEGNLAVFASFGNIFQHSCLNISNSLIRDQYSFSSYNIICQGRALIMMERVVFYNCIAEESSAVIAQFQNSHIRINKNMFIKCRAQEGAIYMSSAYALVYQTAYNLEINNSFVINSHADKSLVYLKGTFLLLKNISIEYSGGIAFKVINGSLIVAQMNIVNFTCENLDKHCILKMEYKSLLRCSQLKATNIASLYKNKEHLFLLLDSKAEISGSELLLYEDSFVGFLKASRSVINISRSSMSCNYARIFYLYEESLFFTNLTNFSYFSCESSFKTNNAPAFYLDNSVVYSFFSCFELFPNGVFAIKNGKFNENVFYATNFTFSKGKNGSALNVLDSNLSVFLSWFASNSADFFGGAIYLRCSENYKGLWTFLSNSFSENTAKEAGGGIYWSLNSAPTILNNSFISNNASYGPNFASEPLYISLENKNLDEISEKLGGVHSGLEIPLCLYFGIRDYYGQLAKTSKSNLVRARMESLYEYKVPPEYLNKKGDFSVLKQVYNYSYEGEFIFCDLILISHPLSLRTLLFSTDEIAKGNEKLLENLLPQQNQAIFKPFFNINGTHFSAGFNVSFDQCPEGAVYYEAMNICYRCPKGTYSFSPSEGACKICPKNARCANGNQITVLPGFWRSNRTSELIYKCSNNNACLQGAKGNDCEVGYMGILCDVCFSDARTGYAGAYFMDLDRKCKSCSKTSRVLTIFFILSVLVLGAGYVIFVIRDKMRTEQNITASLLKIFTDFVQVSAIVMIKDVNWPFRIQDFINIADFRFFQFDDLMISLDCNLYTFISDEYNIYFKKILLVTILIFFTPFFIILLWAFLGCVKKVSGAVIKKKIHLSLAITFYTYQPAVINFAFYGLSCTEVDRRSYLRKYMAQECWDHQHRRIVFFILLPVVLLFTLIIPLLILARLFNRRRSMQSAASSLNFFRDCYKSYYFFWDFFLMSRKLFLICLLTFINDLLFKIIIFNLTIFCSGLLLTMLKPYKWELANRIAILASVAHMSSASFLLMRPLMDGALAAVPTIIFFAGNLLFLFKFTVVFLLLNKRFMECLRAFLYFLPKRIFIYLDDKSGEAKNIELNKKVAVKERRKMLIKGRPRAQKY